MKGNFFACLKFKLLPSVKNKAFRLFLRVMVMIGKLVERVKTGNRLKK
jgi:hypothetical protein